MKKVLKPLVAVALLATAAFAANVENPLYAPAQFGFYSKTGFSSMYKKSDANLAMQAKDWEHKQEFPIWRAYEDFGFGLTNRFAFRGAFGYTHDGAIDRSGPHNARLGLNYRGINSPAEAVVWDIYMDAWLGGISKMKANVIPSKVPVVNNGKDTMPFSFKYDNYANGRWGMWWGTVVGKTFGNLSVSAFGEFQKTFGNSNNQIKIDKKTKDMIEALVKRNVYPGVSQVAYSGVYNTVLGQYIGKICGDMGINPEVCQSSPYWKAIDSTARYNLDTNTQTMAVIKHNADSIAVFRTGGIGKDYRDSLPNSFSVKTKGVVDYVAGLKAFYEIDKDWAMGGGFTWRHRGTNSVEKVNIKNTSKNPDTATVAAITKGIGDGFKGSMEDGVEEYSITLLGTRKITENFAVTLFGEYTFDTAEDKAQLGSDIRAEVGLRFNLQF